MSHYLIRENGRERGPLTLGQVRSLWNSAQIPATTEYRLESAEAWQPLAPLMEAATVVAAPVSPGTPAKSGNLGLALMMIPVAAAFAVYFWVGQMSLAQGPGSTLAGITVATMLISAALIAYEVQQVRPKDATDEGPAVWFFFTLFIWVVALPLYLHRRQKYGLPGLLPAGLVGVGAFVAAGITVHFAIEDRKEELTKKLEALRVEAEQAAKRSW